jgi:hypothetical protein
MYEIKIRPRNSDITIPWKEVARALTENDAQNVKISILDEYPDLDVKIGPSEIRE